MTRLPLAFALLLLPLAAHARPLTLFKAVAVSPDGERIAAIETSDVPVDGERPARLVIRDRAGRATPVTPVCAGTGECQPASPVWNRAGTALSFLVSLGDSSAIETVGAAGGPARRRLLFPGPLDALRAGPDDRLAVLATADASKRVGRTQAGAPIEGEVATRFDEQRIAVVDGSALRFVSPPDLYVYEYDWRPDGGGFVGTAAHGDGDANWWVAGLYAFAAGQPGRLLYQPGPGEQLADPAVAPDGRRVAFIGGWMSDFGSTGGDAYTLALGPEARSVDLTPGLAATVTSLDWHCGPGLTATELALGETRVATLGDGAHLLRRDARTLSAGGWNASLSCADGHAATVAEDFTTPPEILAGTAADLRPVTAVNAGVLAAPGTARSLTWSVDGHTVQGWLLQPSGAGAAKRPLVVDVHGGPEAAAEPEFPAADSDTRALLGQGWDVLEPNYRGSYGEGEAFAAASIQDLGGGDWRDVLAGVDAAERAAPIDDARLAIEGGSYGGYMAMWAVSQTHRFRAAMADAGVSDWLSIEGEAPQAGSDEVNFGGSVYDNPAPYLRASPIAHMRGAATPTFIAVGDRDLECPMPQSQEFHTALLALGVPTSFVVYRDEGHGFTREADRSDRQARTLAWFARWFAAPARAPQGVTPRADNPYKAPMRAEFLKMHGAGNDFVVFDERAAPLALTPARAAALADRRRGIGCDQLIRLLPPTRPEATARMVIHNPDGTESGACGNGTRCVATLLAPGAAIETRAGLLATRRLDHGRVEVDMGPPGLAASDIPLRDGADTLHLPIEADAAACSMGNPHATVFVPDLDAIDVTARGQALGRDPPVPARGQYRLRDRARRPRRDPPARLRARRRPHARLRLGRLRGARQRPSPRAHGPRGAARARWRHAGDRLARGGRPRADDRPHRRELPRHGRARRLPLVSGPEILTFGCRLNAFESEVIRGHVSSATGDLVVVNTCAVTAEAERQARAAIRRLRRERPGARVVVTGCAAQIDPAAWAALPGVARVLGNAEKLRAESWAPGAAGAVASVMDAPPGAAAAGRRVGPRPRLRAGPGRLRPSLHLLHHPLRPRSQPLGAGRRRGRPGPHPGRAGLPRDRAHRRRPHELRPRPARPPHAGGSRPPRPPPGPRAPAPARLVPRPRRDRRRLLGAARLRGAPDAASPPVAAGRLRARAQAHEAPPFPRPGRRRHRPRPQPAPPASPSAPTSSRAFPPRPTRCSPRPATSWRSTGSPTSTSSPTASAPARPPPACPPCPCPSAANARPASAPWPPPTPRTSTPASSAHSLAVLVEKPGLGRSPHYAPVRLATDHLPGTVATLAIRGADPAGLDARP